MAALSQSLIFKVQNGSTTTNSVVLDYPNTATGALTYFSEPVRGEGYYNGGDGLHTVQYDIYDFIGRIEMQGTLDSNPTASDWFTVELGAGNNALSVDTTGLISESNITFVQYSTATTSVKTYNFKGNYIWIRAKVSEWTEGTVNSIKFNH